MIAQRLLYPDCPCRIGLQIQPGASPLSGIALALRNHAQGGVSVSKLLRRPDQPSVLGTPGSLVSRPGQLAASGSLIQQLADNNRTQLKGDLNIRFTDAPVGLRVDEPKTNQPGLSVKPSVGYRTVGSGGSP